MTTSSRMERDSIPVRVAGAAPRPWWRAADEASMEALRDVWRALWLSRALVWTAGVAAILTLGRSPRWPQFDPSGLTAPFGGFPHTLVGPAARWDTTWYLAIALDGYTQVKRTAFFPLYPLLVRIVATPFAPLGNIWGAYLLAGIAVSLVAFAAGLYFVHRLTELEL